MAPAAVLFDFNGTLSRDEHLLCAVYAELFAARGRPMSAADYRDRLAGRSDEEIIGTWLGRDRPDLPALVAERVARYRERAAGGITVSAGARAAVRLLAGRVPLAVVSGAARAEIDDVLGASGLAGAFATIVSAEDVRAGKPDPEGYRIALARLDVAPARALALEDTQAGVDAARAAGVRCLGVRGTMPDERLAGAEEIVPGVTPELARRLLAAG